MDYPVWHGPACVCCGGECSGMGRCDDCDGAMCFICANFEHGPVLSHLVEKRGYRLCDACLGRREEKKV